MVFPWASEIRHNSDGPITSQLGRLHQKGNGERWNALFFGKFSAKNAAARLGLQLAARCAKQCQPETAQVKSTGDGNMAGTIEQKLAAQGITVHEPAAPVANYVGFVRTGNLLFVSGQVCVSPDGKLIAKGKLGAGVTVEQGAAAARGCAINLLAQIKAALGDLDKVVRVVRLGGFVNSAPDFLDGPKVLNGASDLMVAAFGDKGRHARTTVGVASLPSDAAVEVEGVFEVA
jgi:enamine deaminase RidA (YjgF/YER057c/UK114 family)